MRILLGALTNYKHTDQSMVKKFLIFICFLIFL